MVDLILFLVRRATVPHRNILKKLTNIASCLLFFNHILLLQCVSVQMTRHLGVVDCSYSIIGHTYVYFKSILTGFKNATLTFCYILQKTVECKLPLLR